MWGWDKSGDSEQLSYAGLTRASINLRQSRAKEMDCRVKPGNDELGPSRSLLAQHAALTPIPLPESLAPAARATALAAPHGVAICPPNTNRSRSTRQWDAAGPR